MSLMVNCEAATPLKTTSFRCLQIHQNTRMITVHISRLWATGQVRGDHQSRSSVSAAGSQSPCPNSEGSNTRLPASQQSQAADAAGIPAPSRTVDRPVGEADHVSKVYRPSNNGSSRRAMQRTCNFRGPGNAKSHQR
jgi:hypothetical protein